MALQTKTITANGSKGHHKFTLTVIEDGISTPGNYSVVRWGLSISPIHTGYDWSYSSTVPVSYSITIDGETFTGNVMSYDGKSTVTLKNGEKNITHNADGQKTISYSFNVTSLNQSYLTGSASNSGSMALTAIPRAAKVIDADNFFDEANPYLYYSNPAGNSVTSLQACISLTGSNDDIKYRDIPKVGDTYQFILTDSERTTLRNATLNGHDTITVSFHVKTVIGSETFYSSIRRYMSVVNANPTMDPVVEDADAKTLALTGNKNVFIKGYSDAQMVINAKAYKGASIVYQKLEVDGKSSVNEGINANGAAVYPNVVTPTFKFTARDNRGLEVTKTVTKSVVDYIKLTANTEAAIELDSNNSTKSNITAKVTGNYWSGNFGAATNTLIAQYRIKTDSGNWGNWQTITTSISGTTYTASFTIGDLDYQSTYTIQTQVSDKISTITSEEYKLKTIPVFDWGENDFNFNVPVYINNKELDYVVEQGTNNSWFYRKWNSGLAECWRTMSVSGIDVGEFNLNGFYYCGSKGVTFPFTFTQVNYVNATGGSTGNMNIVRPFNHSNSSMTYIVMGMSDVSSATVTVNLEAKGRWK